MVQALTQPPIEMSTRNISLGVKAAGAYCRQLYHLHVPIVLKPESHNLLEHSWSVQTSNGTAVPSTTSRTLNFPSPPGPAGTKGQSIKYVN